MHIILIVIELHIPFAHSLKEKRKHIRSLKDRLQNKFNASVAEIDAKEEWQKSILGITMISSDKRFLESQSSAIEQIVLEYGELELIKIQKEWL
ncbi:MAG: DUF503 domain-containing protein [Gammaproteobacteria bacterium]|nr:DUF503 domain-containing protein [Gammaproteobacteria bacterium]